MTRRIEWGRGQALPLQFNVTRKIRDTWPKYEPQVGRIVVAVDLAVPGATFSLDPLNFSNITTKKFLLTSSRESLKPEPTIFAHIGRLHHYGTSALREKGSQYLGNGSLLGMTPDLFHTKRTE